MCCRRCKNLHKVRLSELIGSIKPVRKLLFLNRFIPIATNRKRLPTLHRVRIYFISGSYLFHRLSAVLIICSGAVKKRSVAIACCGYRRMRSVTMTVIQGTIAAEGIAAAKALVLESGHLNGNRIAITADRVHTDRTNRFCCGIAKDRCGNRAAENKGIYRWGRGARRYFLCVFGNCRR